MKPIHTLTWAVSAPILLFAGASQALTLAELADPACTAGFVYDSVNNKVSCATAPAPTAAPSCTLSANTTSVSTNGAATITASCSQSPTSYAWTLSTGAPAISGNGGTITFPQAGTYTYQVKATNTAFPEGPPSNQVSIAVADAPASGGGSGSVCPSTYQVPAGTTVIKTGGRDNLSKIEYNQAFDAPGNKIDSRSEVGQIKAFEFDNNAFLGGKISGTAGNFGSNYKDWSISACPGDFSTTLPAACRKIRQSGLTMYYHASDATKGCVLPPNQKMYLNIRSNDPTLSAGYVVSNVPSETLP